MNQHTDLAIKACQYTEQMIMSRGEPEHFFQMVAWKNEDDELEIELSFAGESSVFSKAGILEYVKQRIVE
jgi:hypothetical protein